MKVFSADQSNIFCNSKKNYKVFFLESEHKKVLSKLSLTGKILLLKLFKHKTKIKSQTWDFIKNKKHFCSLFKSSLGDSIQTS